MPESLLHKFVTRPSADERSGYIDGDLPPSGTVRTVTRSGEPIDLGPFDALMHEFARRRAEWASARAESDGWLAPRVHEVLRLTRTEASDRGAWLWLAVRHSDYVQWRWEPQNDKEIPEERWYGGVNKQSFARLWWGAELFRDGSDYRPVERAFRRQDLINSFLHRPVVRCRSLALGIIDVVAAGDTLLSSDDVNSLARVLNLATAGAPPEAETLFRRDDRDAYLRWVLAGSARAQGSWDDLPDGPPCSDTSDASKAGGLVVAERARAFAARYATPG